MRRKAAIIANVFFFWSQFLFGGSGFTEWDSYCRSCHIERPVNSLYDPSTKAHSNASLSCVGCHPNKGIAGHLKRSVEKFRLFWKNATLPPDIQPRKSLAGTSEECLACHPFIQEVDEIPRGKLPPNVRQIKLRVAHGRHWDYRTFTSELRDRLKTLKARKIRFSLAKNEQEEMDRLLQIEIMHCSRCHERYKKDESGAVDLKVNIAMKNPMECTACHIALRSAIHPGDVSAPPSAVSCERCHHGALHQKMKFFPVDRATAAECLQCHPGYGSDELIALKTDKFHHKSTGIQKKMAADNGRIANQE